MLEGWNCTNCGHPHPITHTLKEMGFPWIDDRTTKVGCESCGSFVICRSWNAEFTAGEFLLVKAYNRIPGKG